MEHSSSSSMRLVYSCTMPVRWGDMDAYGHVNNTLYLRYLEEARVQMLIDMGEGNIESNELAPVVITVGCTFLRPIGYPNDLRIDCYVGEPGRSSFMTYYKLYTASAPEVVATEGYAKVVWMNHKTGKSVPLPDSVLHYLTTKRWPAS
ncbi:acyl-CoA thioesterase [Thiolinea disciformis]|uniref:acyl-CoA thioesterase n=1 Tax=Thiolinea disciformis TaxID=125614 RepID=UPI000DA11C84|nr:thioesterase family protein [Thiolinea disciformis]